MPATHRIFKPIALRRIYTNYTEPHLNLSPALNWMSKMLSIGPPALAVPCPIIWVPNRWIIKKITTQVSIYNNPSPFPTYVLNIVMICAVKEILLHPSHKLKFSVAMFFYWHRPWRSNIYLGRSRCWMWRQLAFRFTNMIQDAKFTARIQVTTTYYIQIYLPQIVKGVSAPTYKFVGISPKKYSKL